MKAASSSKLHQFPALTEIDITAGWILVEERRAREQREWRGVQERLVRAKEERRLQEREEELNRVREERRIGLQAFHVSKLDVLLVNLD